LPPEIDSDGGGATHSKEEKLTQVELSEVIASPWKDLARAKEAGEDESLKFEVNHIEVELHTTSKRSTELKSEGRGTLKFLVEIGASISGAESNRTAQSHLIQLNLTPLKKNDDNKKSAKFQKTMLSAGQ
jgi:hypothetical protein